jgi:peptidoglycan/xylan/chitin deacetylase (PgdA/CDA1 family)
MNDLEEIKMDHGAFVISLDHEQYWGVRDVMSIEQARPLMTNTKRYIPQLLNLFEDHHIHATWAIVGMLFFDNKEELIQNFPKSIPKYQNDKYNPYNNIGFIGENEDEDPLHFGLESVNAIKNTKYQEIGTHTFSHYYCCEEGPCLEDFEEDLKLALAIGQKRGVEIRSIILPRNQITDAHLTICKKVNLVGYRGNPEHPLYQQGAEEDYGMSKKIQRILDLYINYTGFKTSSPQIHTLSKMVNIPASQFFYWYLHPWDIAIKNLKIRRIKKAMEYAAKNHQIYHLWWHPHNWGFNTDKNLSILKEILQYYLELHDRYNFQSMNMLEIGTLATNLKAKSS